MRWLPLAILLLSCGCAKYEYNITTPPEFARHVGRETEQLFTRDTLEYRWVTVDNRLVMRIYNPSDAPAKLLGDKSVVVDEDGQSHAFPGQTIAPHSFIKIILPPLRPTIERSGPSFGIGIGTSVSSRRGYGYGAYGTYDDFDDSGPRYFDVYTNDAMYWEWNGQTPIRLTLSFEHEQKTYTHEFGISRQKM